MDYRKCEGLSIFSELFEMQITSVLHDLGIPLPEDRGLGQAISESAFSSITYDATNQLIFCCNLLLETA